MAVIKYRVGYENSVIVEKGDFEGSIFCDPYVHACRLVDRFLRQPIEDNLQIVAFCGERGSGKTSCMKSVMEVISQAQAYEAAGMEKCMNEDKGLEAHVFLHKFGLHKLSKEAFEIPPMIDPSFFDRKNNIIELLIGQIYGDLRAIEQNSKLTLNRIQFNSVHDSLSKVKACLLTIHGVEDNTFNRYSELSVLSHAVRLKEEARKLIRNYLKLKGKSRLLLSVDDLDLNIEGAYEMCEQIRKYLAFPECIVFLSFNYSQLIDSISTAMGHDVSAERHYLIKGQSHTDKYTSLAIRYLDKFVSSGERIHMPMAYDRCNRQLRIYDKGKVYVRPSGEDTVKDTVVNLIFQKTRFLFYNSKGGISPIVPNNLRELFQLLGLLWGMEELPSDKSSDERRRVLELNKQEFKTYFFDYWTECLPLLYKLQAKEWVYNIPNNILNKHLVRWIGEEFKEEFNRNYELNDDSDVKSSAVSNLYKQITSPDTFSYNVSTGDLFFLISLLQRDTLSPDKERILFFIRSYYSILLFEAYDVVTENPGERYPAASEGSGIYRMDHRFDHTNELQRLVNGSFFTYWPGELISNPKDKEDPSRDLCVISGSGTTFKDLFKKCREVIESYDIWRKEWEDLMKSGKEEETEEVITLEKRISRSMDQFRLTEFLALSLNRSIPQKQLKQFKDSNTAYREDVEPFDLYTYNSHMGYYVYDAVYPFYALVNPRFAYGRFDDLIGVGRESDDNGIVGKDLFFNFALSHEFSLLRQMIDKVYGKTISEEGTNETKEIWLSRLQSDAMIRNSEVLMAVFENAVSQKNRNRGEGERFLKLIEFYRKIRKSGLVTHRVGHSENDVPYRIDFSFLDAIMEFLSQMRWDENLKSEFDLLFAPVVNLTKGNTNTTSKQSAKKDGIDSAIKGSFMTWLDNQIGPFPLTASEIRSKLKEKVEWMGKLPEKEMNKYVLTKPYNDPFSLEQLSDHIFKNKARWEKWQVVWGTLINKQG